MSIANASLAGNVEFDQSLPPALRAASATGAASNLSGASNWTFQVSTGAWTDGTHTISFEHRLDPTAAWVAIDRECLDGFDSDGVQLLTEVAGPPESYTFVISDATTDDSVFLFTYTGGHQDIRAVATVTGAPATGAVYGVAVAKAGLRYKGRNPGILPRWKDGGNEVV